MNHILSHIILKLCIALLCTAVFLSPVFAAENELKTFDNPGGGQIVYGPLADQSSLKDSMVAMLRNVHGHFGARPEIGRLFQTRENDSLATFFTATAKNQGGRRIAGLVIVAMPNGSKPAAAVLYDDADRFGKTLNPMMKKLNELWHVNSAPTPQPAAAVAKGGPVPPLRQTAFPDNSGSIGLPAGWKIVSAAGGAVMVSGPNGEDERLSLIHQVIDPTTPQGNSMIQMYTANGRKPMPEQWTVYPYGRDLVETFKAFMQQFSQKSNLPVPTLVVNSTTKIPPTQYQAYGVEVTGEIDMHDGKGPRAALVQLGELRRVGPAYWSLTTTLVSVPKQFAQAEWPTMLAVANSMNQNSAVIQAQTKTVIDQIHRVGEAAKQRSDAANAADDARRASFEAHMDSIDRTSKSFQEYQLDQSVVVDTHTGEHATGWNQAADALVKSDPNRYQYVSQENLLRGVDY
jgi:hypothetical protein